MTTSTITGPRRPLRRGPAADDAPRRKRAVLYLRVSSFKQIRPDDPEGLSIPDQRLACQQYAERLGAEIAMEYIERSSAKSAKTRPALQNMLADLRSRSDIDYVIFWKLERFARKTFDVAIVGQELEDMGIEICSASEYIDSSPAGRFMRGVLASHAEYDNAIRAERARMAMTRKAELGGTPYKPPPGYRLVHTEVDGRRLSTSELDPDAAEIMRYAFVRYSGGDISIVHLAEELAAMGLRNSNGRTVVPSQLHTLLSHPYYLGKVPFRGKVYDNGRHPAIVDQDTFDRVQAMLSARASAGERQRKHNHYLKGTVYCGRCGRRLVFNRAKGNGGTYDYYFCLGRREGCPSRHMKVATIEQAILDEYRTVSISASSAEKVRLAVRSYVEATRSRHDDHESKVRARLSAVERKRDRLFEAYAAEAMSVEQFKKKQTELDREAELSSRQLEVAIAIYENLETIATKALAVAVDAHAAYSGASDLGRRLINQAIFERIYVVEDGEVERTDLVSPFCDLLDEAFQEELREATAELLAPETSNRRGLSSAGGWNKQAMAPPVGFEPTTLGLEVLCSIQLSYRGQLGLEP